MNIHLEPDSIITQMRHQMERIPGKPLTYAEDSLAFRSYMYKMMPEFAEMELDRTNPERRQEIAETAIGKIATSSSVYTKGNMSKTTMTLLGEGVFAMPDYHERAGAKKIGDVAIDILVASMSPTHHGAPQSIISYSADVLTTGEVCLDMLEVDVRSSHLPEGLMRETTVLGNLGLRSLFFESDEFADIREGQPSIPGVIFDRLLDDEQVAALRAHLIHAFPDTSHV